MTKQILILDDNASNLQLLFIALNTSFTDGQIYQTKTIQEAQAILDTHPIDLAVLDVELPDGSGIELAATQRQKSPTMLLVMLSAIDARDELDRACHIGANAYITKPFDLGEVLELLKILEYQVNKPKNQMMVLYSRSGLYPYQCVETEPSVSSE